MTNARFAAELFPQHTRAGVDAVMDALKDPEFPADELDRLRDENAELRCRNQELEAERDELLDRIEELEWEHKDDEPRVVQRG